MTPGLGFALGAMLLFGASDLIYKRAAAAQIEPSQFVMLQSWVFCPGITLYAWASGTLDARASALWGALAGLFSLIAFSNFARSLKDGAVSTNAPIFRLNFTLTAALAIVLLGETLTVTKAAALLCALVAVWLLLAEPGAGKGVTAKSLTRVLIATVAMAFANLFYKIGLSQGALPETMVAAQAWVFSSSATLFVLARDKRLRLTPHAWRFSLPASLALVVAFVLLMHALSLGPASVLVPVAQMSFVFTALLGAAMFRERLNARKQLGLAVAVAALGLFAVS
ncbi:MAG TPA: DMT family transporter [Pseudolabrys sp.]|nr:DMT family transporter [Pseudolabrys sp.]